jgi:Insertion element 4 transposase N-terminal
MAGGGPRWSDRVAIGALTQTYPPALVDEVLAQTGRREQRTRLLPARMVVYYLLALALFADVAYLEVLRLLTEALRRPSRRGRGGPMRLPVKSALIQARARLGPAPLKALFDQAAVPLATPTTLGRGIGAGGCWPWTEPVDAPDTPANADAFGRPRSGAARVLARSRRRGWSGWWSAAPTRSWVRCLDPTPTASRPWRPGCSGAWMRGCCCWPVVCRRGDLAAGTGQRRGTGLAGADRPRRAQAAP